MTRCGEGLLAAVAVAVAARKALPWAFRACSVCRHVFLVRDGPGIENGGAFGSGINLIRVVVVVLVNVRVHGGADISWVVERSHGRHGLAAHLRVIRV